MNTYIISQMMISSRTREGIDTNILMTNTIRKVEAETRDSAIGKFVLATQDIKAVQKLDIDCYQINEIESIK